MLGKLKPLSGKTKDKILTFNEGLDTVNAPLYVQDGYNLDVLNISSRNYPSCTQRFDQIYNEIASVPTAVKGSNVVSIMPEAMGSRDIYNSSGVKTGTGLHYLYILTTADGERYRYWVGELESGQFTNISAEHLLNTDYNPSMFTTFNAGSIEYTIASTMNDNSVISEALKRTVKGRPYNVGGTYGYFLFSENPGPINAGEDYISVFSDDGQYYNKIKILSYNSGTLIAQMVEEWDSTVTKSEGQTTNGSVIDYCDFIADAGSVRDVVPFVAAHQERYFAAFDKTLCFSNRNLPYDFTTVNLAGSITISNAKTNLTAGVSYNGKLIVFDKYGMNELYGTSPFNFNLQAVQNGVGCVSQKSITIINGLLYWAAYDGIYEYNGSYPVKISEPFANNGVIGGIAKYIGIISTDDTDADLKTITCGSKGNYLYVYYKGKVFTFDTRLRKWSIENFAVDSPSVTPIVYDYLTYSNKTLAFVDNGDAENYKCGFTELTVGETGNDTIGEADIAIPFSFITKPFNFNLVGNKATLQDMWLQYNLPTDSTLKLYYSPTTDGTDDWIELMDFMETDTDQTQRIQIPTSELQRLDWFRFKFEGAGKFNINMANLILKFSRR